MVIDGGIGSTLPVKLGLFTVSVSSNKVNLRWRTASETNVSNFSIESSSNGVEFTAIGSRVSQGHNRDYTFEDIVMPGVTYYRLKMIDSDGKFKYSQVMTVNGSISGKNLSLYPNPVISDLIISHPKAKPGARVDVITLSGIRLFSQSISPNNTQSTIYVNSLTAGNYILIYHNGGEKQIANFKKQ